MKIQQSTQGRNHHYRQQREGNPQQVNCKGDKIENITQLLMHLGMDDIKEQCDDCDIAIRTACLAKQSKGEPVNRAKFGIQL